MSQDLWPDPGRFYPGSNQPIVRDPAPSTVDPDMGRTVSIGGVRRRVFSTGEVARLLNRKTVTIRTWEQKGIIPRAVYVKPGKNKDKRGRRRLYTQEQVEGMVRIAAEEGILDNPNRAISRTQFSVRVFALFKELGK